MCGGCKLWFAKLFDKMYQVPKICWCFSFGSSTCGSLPCWYWMLKTIKVSSNNTYNKIYDEVLIETRKSKRNRKIFSSRKNVQDEWKRRNNIQLLQYLIGVWQYKMKNRWADFTNVLYFFLIIVSYFLLWLCHIKRPKCYIFTSCTLPEM